MKGEGGEVWKKEGENSEAYMKHLHVEKDNAKIQINITSPLGEGVKRESCIFFGNYREERERNQWHEIIGKQGH